MLIPWFDHPQPGMNIHARVTAIDKDRVSVKLSYVVTQAQTFICSVVLILNGEHAYLGLRSFSAIFWRLSSFYRVCCAWHLTCP